MATRADGLKEVTLQIGYNEHGRRIIKHFYGHSKAEAMRKRDEYKKAIDAGIKPDAEQYTVSRWIEEYESVYGAVTSNANKARIKEALGNLKISKVTEADCQRLMNSCAGLSFSLVTKMRMDVKRIFKKAKQNRLIQFDPTEGIEMPSCTKGTHRALDQWEIAAIINHYEEAYFGPLVFTMLMTGMRHGEAVALMWDCVDLDNKIIKIRRSQREAPSGSAYIHEGAKTEAGIRDIPIVPKLEQYLQSVPVEKRSGFVFHVRTGNHISPTVFRNGLSRFCSDMTRITGKDFSIRSHDLRHTFCTGLYDSGIDVKTAQVWLGHSDIKITLAVYTHISQGHCESETEKLNERLFVNCS